MQRHGRDRLGLHWERHKGGAAHYLGARSAGRAMPVAAVIGGDPACVFAAGAPLPEGIDEYAFAGFLRGAPVELCPAVSVDLDVPARAEIVIEGTVLPGETAPEGPFGDHTGFYDPGGPYPVMRVSAVTMRRDPIYLTTVVGRPPSEEHFLLGRTSERLFLPLVQALLPEVVDVHAPPEGVATNLLFVALRKRYPGHAYKAAYALWGLGQLALTKVVVVVDDWVPLRQPGAAWWAALANCDPARDVLVARGPGSVLDHALSAFSFGGKLVVDGTRKGPEEAGARAADWPRPVAGDPEIAARVSRRWAEFGLGPDPGPVSLLPAPASGPPGWSGAPPAAPPAGLDGDAAARREDGPPETAGRDAGAGHGEAAR
jgi:4-hydroxy-3-polyprenylbenzoate decarboxylase